VCDSLIESTKIDDFESDFVALKLQVHTVRDNVSPGKNMVKYYSEEEEPLPRLVIVRRHLRLVVDYLFFLLYGVIGLQIILELAGAHEASGFMQFLNKVNYPFLNPFVGMFSDPILRGRFHLRISFLVALCIYLFLHLAVLGLFRLFERSKRLT
jgi:hypothetical protein